MAKNRKKPLFSIVTVSYNAENTIETTIKSVINQNINQNNYEYIIIDGKSTDGTLDIIKKYKYGINNWISEEDSGIYDAMNKGIKLSNGQLVYFLNADDKFHKKDVLSKVKKDYLRKNKPDILYGKILYIDEKVPARTRIMQKKFSNLKSGVTVQHQGIFMKREVFNEIGLFNVNYKIAADYDLMSRISKNNYSIELLDYIICDFLAGGKGENPKLVTDENSKVLKKHFGFYYYIKYLLQRKVRLFFTNILKNLNLYKKYINLKYKLLKYINNELHTG